MFCGAGKDLVHLFFRGAVWYVPRLSAGSVKVMSGMEKQIADLSSREESNTGIAKESKQKVR